MMYREDYARMSLIVDVLFVSEPATHEEGVWNLAIHAASAALRSAGVGAEWAPAPGLDKKTP